MKKIVALVLALALALSLCTVAMAYSDDKFDLYPATSANLKDGALKATASATSVKIGLKEVAASEASDGSGTVAYLEGGNHVNYVKTTTPTTNDYAVTENGKTTILYYVTALTNGVEYKVAAKEFTNFGTTTGKVYSPADNATYYVDGDDVVYCDKNDANVEGGEVKLLVDGAIVKAYKVKSSEDLKAGQVVAAKYLVTATKASASTGKLVPTEVTDVNSNTKYTTIYKAGKAPAGSTVVNVPASALYDDAYVFVKTAATAAGTTTTVDSSKTFDAGVAMYVGLSLMSVAGSAVVIGKKKEF